MSTKSERQKYNVKEENHEKRVRMYSIPGVQEVIYPDEWVMEKRRKRAEFMKNLFG